MLNIIQQIHDNVAKSRRTLIAFRRDYNGDALASSLGLAEILRKMGKEADVACDGFNYPEHYNFLKNLKTVRPDVSGLKKITLTMDLENGSVKNLDYEIKNNKLQIHLVPENDGLKIPRVNAEEKSYKYDLIFTVNTPDLESLGKIYDSNPDFFYYTPLINIDHLPQNESYGQINMVDIVSSSAAEIIFNMLEYIGKDYLDEDIATHLLTGIITKTKSFRAPNITPKTLNIAGQLLVAGGRREDIIKNLYNNKSLHTLKLWGRVLARLKNDNDKKIVWSTLSQQDFIAASGVEQSGGLSGGTEENAMLEVIYELIANSPEADMVVLLHENRGGDICVHIYSEKNINVLEAGKMYGAEGTKNLAKFHVNGKNLVEAEREVIKNIKQFV